MYSDTSKEMAARMCELENEKYCRCGQRNVDAVFDGRENGHENCGSPDEELEWIDAPEPVYLWGLRDEINHRVDNDGGEPGRRNPVEGRCETIQGDDDNNAAEDAR